MDSMNKAELDGKVDFSKKGDPKVESRIRRIAAGSGSHPLEVQMLLQCHKQFESMVGKMGKSGMMGKGMQAKQQQMAAQMRKNPNLIQQRLNQMVCNQPIIYSICGWFLFLLLSPAPNLDIAYLNDFARILECCNKWAEETTSWR